MLKSVALFNNRCNIVNVVEANKNKGEIQNVKYYKSSK